MAKNDETYLKIEDGTKQNKVIFILGETNTRNLVTVVQDCSFPCGAMVCVRCEKMMCGCVFLSEVLVEGPQFFESYHPRGALSGIVQSWPQANLWMHFDSFSPQLIQIG